MAIGASVVALVLVIWGFGALFSGSQEPGSQNAANVGDSGWRPPQGASAPGPSMPPSSGSPAPSSAPPSSSSAAPAPAVSKTAAPPSKPAEPAACATHQLGLVATVDKAEFRVGEHPNFTMILTNVGGKPCTQDVNRAKRDLTVTSTSGKRIWSSVDCYFGSSKPERKPLQPGHQETFRVTWLGSGSTPGCPTQRGEVKPGDYKLTAKIGGLSSGPTKFTVTK
jgi:hypothetical protein